MVVVVVVVVTITAAAVIVVATTMQLHWLPLNAEEPVVVVVVRAMLSFFWCLAMWSSSV